MSQNMTMIARKAMSQYMTMISRMGNELESDKQTMERDTAIMCRIAIKKQQVLK